MTNVRDNAGDDGLFPPERAFRAGVRRSTPEIDLSGVDLVVAADAGGTVYALDAANGTVYWDSPIDGDVSRFSVGLTVSEKTVYIGSEDENVYALDLSTGEVKWSYKTSAVFNSSVTVVDDIAYFASDDAYAYDVSSKSEKWSKATNISGSSPRVKNDSVYVGGGKILYRLAKDDGSTDWSTNVGDLDISSPDVDDSQVYISVADGTDSIKAYDKDTGSFQWSVTGTKSPLPPNVVDSTVYWADGSTELYAIDASTGSIDWTYKPGTSTDAFGAPVVKDGTVYITDLGEIFAVDASDGSKQWRKSLSNKAYTTPTVGNGKVFVGDSVAMRALDPADGSEIWSTNLGEMDASPTLVKDGDSAGARINQHVLGHI